MKGQKLSGLQWTLSVALCAALLTAAGGCGSKQDKLANNMVSNMNDMADTMAKIKTTDDVKTYKPDLQAESKKMDDYFKQAQDMKLSDADQKALQDKYKDQVTAAEKRMETEMSRIGTAVGPQASMDLMDAMPNGPAGLSGGSPFGGK